MKLQDNDLPGPGSFIRSITFFLSQPHLNTDQEFQEKLEIIFKDSDSNINIGLNTDSDSDSNCFNFHQFISELLQLPFWQENDSPDNQIKTLCLALSLHIENIYQVSFKEPAYHSKLHFKDVCLALTVLLSIKIESQDGQASQTDTYQSIWNIDKHSAWVLLFSAIAHDFMHDGRIAQNPYEMEEISLEKLKQWMAQEFPSRNMTEQIMLQITPLILATDPRYLHTLVRKLSEQDSHLLKTDCMAMLLIEADIFASTLPQRGVDLGKLLSEEWAIHNSRASENIKRKQGRLEFLKFIKFLSPQSQKTGIESTRKISIDKILKELSCLK